MSLTTLSWAIKGNIAERGGKAHLAYSLKQQKIHQYEAPITVMAIIPIATIRTLFFVTNTSFLQLCLLLNRTCYSEINTSPLE